MSDSPGARACKRLAWLVSLGLVLRLLAAVAVELAARRRGLRCLFPDTNIYWDLGRALRLGMPYVVDQWGVPHVALRTPGYPLFLALGQALFGPATLPIRLVQAVIGAACIPIVHVMVSRLTRKPDSPAATTAAVLTALDPWTIATSALLLSEAIFLPLLLLSLWGLAGLWTCREAGRRASPWAVATGAFFGAGILVKPSWALFPPAAVAVLVLSRRRTTAVRQAALLVLGLVLVMSPWWVRNARLTGRFVPTALWMGASLYDGLHPGATGASDMRFLEAPDVRRLDESSQDRELTRRAAAFVQEHPARTIALAGVKAARFWSPWPNAEAFRAPPLMLGGLLVMLPVYALILLGAWDRRRDGATLMVCLAPLLYFALLHMVFVSSVRYRVVAMVPAFGLAGFGWGRLVAYLRGWRPARSESG